MARHPHRADVSVGGGESPAARGIMKTTVFHRNHRRPETRAVSIPILTDDDERAGRPPHDVSLRLRSVHYGASDEGVENLLVHTDRGSLSAFYHPVDATHTRHGRAVVWVPGAGGGTAGPAHGLYAAACSRLQQGGVAGLRIDYRRKNELADCILDALIGSLYLGEEGFSRIGIVGHSFGGAVAISAGALSGDITAVLAMATQTYGADLVPQVSPRPLLLVHGTADEVLPAECSEIVYAAAREPKELKLFEAAGHGLDGVADELLDYVVGWLEDNV